MTVAILAVLLLGWFNTIGGGEARYRQLFAIVSHSAVIWMIAGVIAAVTGYFTAKMTTPGQLDGLFPMLEDGGFLSSFFKFVDVFWIWGLSNLAIGVAVLYQKRTGAIASTFIVIYLVVGLAVAVVRSSLGV